MHILVPIDFFPPYLGGVEIAALEISKNLVNLGHEVTVFTTKLQGDTSSEVRDGVHVIRFPALFSIYRMLLNPGLFVKLLTSVKNFDVVHTYFPAAFAPFSSAISSKFNKNFPPVVLTFCNDPPVRNTLYDMYIHFLLRNVDSIVSISENFAQRSEFLNYYQTKTSVIPVGVDLKRFQPSNNQKLISMIKQPYILFVSKLDKFHAYKGLDVLLRAFRKVILQFPNILLLVVGSGELQPAYERLVRSFGLQQNVRFLDITIYENVEYYLFSEFVVAPTKDWRQEGFGLVPIEALACKKPVITTEYIAAAREIADHGLGLVVPPNDEKQLAMAMIQLLSDSENCKKMGQKGRAVVEQKYSYDNIAKDYISLFTTLLND